MIVNISGKTAYIGDSVLLPRLGILSDHPVRENTMYLVDKWTFEKYRNERSDILMLDEYNRFVRSDE